MDKYTFDTIAAIATPFGNGGVGIIRISGNFAFDIIEKISNVKNLTPNKIHHAWIFDDCGNYIDEVIILPFIEPHSYTGENVIEIQAHGGIHNLNNILNLVLSKGARLALRGEFTKRAFLNKKLDLTQAESVLDLIHAKSCVFSKKSAQNLKGKLKNEIESIKGELFNVLSKIIASLDFPEDVVEPSNNEILSVIETSINKIEKILNDAKNSNLLRQGIHISIIGKVNAGKSSLFNQLLGLNRAIVTDTEGTTRDVLYESFDINGICATLIDTAGIRDENSIDEVEKIGINLSKSQIETSDIVLFLIDLSKKPSKDDYKLYELIANKKHIIVGTKFDIENYKIENIFKSYPNFIKVSIKDRLSIDELKQKIYNLSFDTNSVETQYITNLRQQECLKNALESLNLSKIAIKNKTLLDLVSIDLKDAIISLGEVSGESINDEILNNIFENFCIGK